MKKESKEGSEKGVGIKNIPSCLGLIVYMKSLRVSLSTQPSKRECRITSHVPFISPNDQCEDRMKVIFFICGGFAQGQLRFRTAYFNYEECLLKDI